jgi:Na+-driven multidrug efflux pump
MGIGMRIEQIVLMPALGISISVLAVVAQNHGSKDYERIDETLRVAIRYSILASIIGMLILYFEARFFVSLFSDDTHVIAEGIQYAKIAAFALLGYLLIFSYLSLLQGIQKPAMLLYISIARQIVLPLIIFTIFKIANLGVESLWWGITAIVWLSALFVIGYTKKVLHDGCTSV